MSSRKPPNKGPSNRRIKRNPAIKEERDLAGEVELFVTHKSPEFRISRAEKLLRARTPLYVMTAGSMLIETANSEGLAEDERVELLDWGRSHWQEVYDNGRRSGNTLSLEASSVAGRLATLGSLSWIIRSNSIAPREELEASYFDLLEAGQEQARSVDAWPSANEGVHFIGDLAETSIMLLLLRDVLRREDTETLPAYSFLSEDQRDRKGSWLKKSWDVTMFTEYPPNPPSQAYKIQVKSIRPENATLGPREIHYDQGEVEMVYVRDDLSLNNRAMSCGAIVWDCVREQEGLTDAPTNCLDRRTEMLWDILG